MFTLELSISLTTANGVEEKVSVASQLLTPELIVEIKGKVSDLVAGENQAQPTDTISVNAVLTSDTGGTKTVSGNYTIQEATDFITAVNSAFGVQE